MRDEQEFNKRYSGGSNRGVLSCKLEFQTISGRPRQVEHDQNEEIGILELSPLHLLVVSIEQCLEIPCHKCRVIVLRQVIRGRIIGKNDDGSTRGNRSSEAIGEAREGRRERGICEGKELEQLRTQ